jgi:uncharacterized membrane protein
MEAPLNPPLFPPWASIVLWWTAFAGSHMVLSSPRVRRSLVARLGEGPFAGIYSLVALATFVPLVWTYAAATHTGPQLWSFTGIAAVRWLAIGLAAVGVALVAASFVQPSATGMDPRAAPRARGLTRITRHPLFAGLGLWGLAHVLTNGFLSDVVFFGGFPLFALVGGAHQDERKRLDHGHRLAAYMEETSLVPFGAIVRGRNRLAMRELPWPAFAAGVAIAAALYLAHPLLF